MTLLTCHMPRNSDDEALMLARILTAHFHFIMFYSNVHRHVSFHGGKFYIHVWLHVFPTVRAALTPPTTSLTSAIKTNHAEIG